MYLKLQTNIEQICALTYAEIQSVISDYALEHLYNAQLTTGRSVKSKGSAKGSSEKGPLALLQNELRAKQNLKLL